jgi:hypothetical protein
LEGRGAQGGDTGNSRARPTIRSRVSNVTRARLERLHPRDKRGDPIADIRQRALPPRSISRHPPLGLFTHVTDRR